MSAVLLCLILAVPDGDGLRAQCEGRKSPLSIRLTEIDAPETKKVLFGQRIPEQPFAKEAQQQLSAWCYQQQAVVHRTGTDRNGRALAKVECNGIQVNEEMVKAGLAWSFMPSKRSTIPALEAQAKAAKKGLWSDPWAVAPSAWRKGDCP